MSPSDIFTHYWKDRGISCPIPIECKTRDHVHYLSHLHDGPVPFQHSYLTDEAVKNLTNNGANLKPFQRLNYPGEQHHYAYIPLPWNAYQQGKPVYIVEGIPDTLSLLEIGLLAIGISSKGVVVSAISELSAFFTYAGLQQIIVMPDTDAWDLWCHAFKDATLTPMLFFVDFHTVRTTCQQPTAKDMNALLVAVGNHAIIQQAITTATVHEYDVHAHYDLERINDSVSAEQIKDYLCTTYQTTAEKDGKQWRILGQSGLFVHQDKRISRPGDGKGAGGYGILGAATLALTGGWKTPDSQRFVTEILPAANALAGISPTYHVKTTQQIQKLPQKSQLPQEQPPHPAEEEAHSFPDWGFWEGTLYNNTIHYSIDVIRYLKFLSDHFTFRVFMKRDTPVIVAEQAGGFTYCIQRGTQILDVKNAIIDFLKTEGFPEIANEMLLKTRLFSLDVLENLPVIDKEKVRESIFAQGRTRVNLQDEYIDKEPIMYYQEKPEERKIYLLNRHDIGVIVSRQGMGKSTAIELLISHALTPCEPKSPFYLQMASDELILHFDTERTHDDNLRMLRRIAKRTHAVGNKLLNDEQEFSRFILEMCADDVDDIGFWILEKIESIQQKIGLIIIDTLLDTIPDMNSQELAVKFHRDLRHAAKVRNCACLCTIHAAPDSKDEDGKGMGHIGSLFMRKASTFLQVRTAKEDYHVKILSSDFKNAKIRNSPDYGLFAAFTWGTDGLAHFIDYTPPKTTAKQNKLNNIKDLYDQILKHGALSKPDLLAQYKDIAGVSEKTAYTHYEAMSKQGRLVEVRGKVQWKEL